MPIRSLSLIRRMTVWGSHGSSWVAQEMASALPQLGFVPEELSKRVLSAVSENVLETRGSRTVCRKLGIWHVPGRAMARCPLVALRERCPHLLNGNSLSSAQSPPRHPWWQLWPGGSVRSCLWKCPGSLLFASWPC